MKSSHAKKARPLNSKKSIHVVMASKYARGPRSLLKHERWIENLARKLGRKKGVKIYRVANSGQSLNLLLRFKKRREFLAFLRAFSGLIARRILAAEKGRARRHDTAYKHANRQGGHSEKIKGIVVKSGERFWDQRPFTQMIDWGPAHQQLSSLLALPAEMTSQILKSGFLPHRWVKAMNTKMLYGKVMAQLQKLNDFYVPAVPPGAARGNTS